MRVLTWNIACLPSELNFYRNPHGAVREILKRFHSSNSDLVLLQEVFDYKIRDRLRNILSYRYHLYNSEKCSSLIPKNGLLIASKFPILKTYEM